MSFPSVFEDETSLYDFLNERGLSLRRPSPVLKLEPKMPAMPRTYRGYEMEPVKSDPFHVWVGDRDKVTGAWRRIGSPINEQDVGRTTFGTIGRDQVYQPRHHNVNIAAESKLSDDQLKARLSELGLPSEGGRYDLYKRYINTKTSPLMERLADGHQPTNEELINIVNRDHDVMDQLQQANTLRQQRIGQPPQENPGLRQRWQQSRLNPTNWRTQSNNPMRVDGTQVSNVEGANLRQWGEQNLQNQLNNTSTLNRLGTGGNPMTTNNMSGALGATGTNEAVATGAGNLGRASVFANRALPVMNLALLAGMMMQNSRANRENRYAEQAQKTMRT